MLELGLLTALIFAFIFFRNLGGHLLSNTGTCRIYKSGIVSKLYVCSHDSKYYELAFNVSPKNILWKNSRLIFDRASFKRLLNSLVENKPGKHRSANLKAIKVVSAPANAEAAITLSSPLGWSQGLILREAINSLYSDFTTNKI